MKFFRTPNFWKLRRVPHQCFRHCQIKNFPPKIVTLPTSLSDTINLSDTRNFLNHRRVTNDVFRHCETENFNEKSWYLLLSIKTFGNTEGFPHQCFRHCQIKNFRRKIVTLPTSLFLPLNLFDTRNFPNHRRVPLQNFSVLWDIKIWTENRVVPLLRMKFFDTRNQWNTKGFPEDSFGTVRDKIVSIKYYHPLLAKNLSVPEDLSNREGSPKKFFETMRQRMFDGKT